MATNRPAADSTAVARGLTPGGEVRRNLSVPALYMEALKREEGVLAEGGPLVVDTGHHTGRSPNDKFVVREPSSEDRIWWGKVNQPLEQESYDGLREKVIAYLSGRDLYVIDAFAGADPAHRISIRVVVDHAYHALFARTMFITPSDEDLAAFEPEAVVLHAPGLEADPDADGTRSGTFIALHPAQQEMLIGGTYYAGEIKKSIFTS